MSLDHMSVRLHLCGLRVLEVSVDTPTRLEVVVESSAWRLRCPHCGFWCRRVHDRREKRVLDLSVSGRPATLRWRRRRFVCGGCGERHLETHPEFDGKLTRRLARRLVVDAQQMSLRAVARTHGVGWHLIMGHVGVWAGLIGDRRRRQRCRVLLVDETSIRRRHRYVTVIVNGDTGQVLDMLPGRSEASLSRFFAAQGARWCRGVQVVVSDGSKPYRAAIDRHLGHATHVLDRFHVIGWFAAGLTAVRRDVQRHQPAGTTPAFDPDVFRARFVLLRRPDRLDDAQRAQLEAIFETHPRLRDAWDALGELHGLYLADDKAGALAALDRFTDLYQTGDLPEFHKIVNTLLAHMPQILAWHAAGRPSNGRIEGTNTCWGGNGFGEATAPDGEYSAVTAGFRHSCGLRTDGTITCWGRNYWGEATAPGGQYSAVAAGSSHSCGLRTNGTITCWGRNYNAGGDYLGQATAPDGQYSAVAAGDYHSCGLRTDGTITCWGRNYKHGDYVGQATAPDGQYSAVAAGDYHSCGLRTDGTITCWGTLDFQTA